MSALDYIQTMFFFTGILSNCKNLFDKKKEK